MEQTSGIIRYISPVKAFKKPRKHVIPVRLGIPRKSLSPHFLFLQKPLKTLIFQGFSYSQNAPWSSHGANCFYLSFSSQYTDPYFFSILVSQYTVPSPVSFHRDPTERYIPASVLGTNKSLIRMPVKRSKTTQMHPRSAQILRSRGFFTSFWGFLARNGVFWPYFPLSFLICGVFRKPP